MDDLVAWNTILIKNYKRAKTDFRRVQEAANEQYLQSCYEDLNKIPSATFDYSGSQSNALEINIQNLSGNGIQEYCIQYTRVRC